MLQTTPSAKVKLFGIIAFTRVLGDDESVERLSRNEDRFPAQIAIHSSSHSGHGFVPIWSM